MKVCSKCGVRMVPEWTIDGNGAKKCVCSKCGHILMVLPRK